MTRCLNCMEEYQEVQNQCPNCGFVKGTLAKEVFHLNPGVELKNRYIIGTVVSYGGFGVVYVAWDTTLQCKVAIKEYFPSALVTRAPGTLEVKPVNGNRQKEFYKGRERFLLEAKIMTQFDGHPNIVSIMNFFEENGTAYIVMEFLDGVTLKDYMKMEGNVIDVETAREIIMSICDIVGELHKKKVLHRDLAPDNIMICLGGKVKLIDFGAARLAEKDNKLTKVLKMGFAPPEQYSSDKEQGEYTDVYALGATLYRMVTGEMPEEATNRKVEDNLKKPQELNPNIPQQMSNAILSAMAVVPELRYQSMKEFKEALQGKKVAVDPVAELKRRKRKRILGVSAAVVLIGAGVLVGYHMMKDKKETAQLPTASIEVWVPTVSGEAVQTDMKDMIAEFHKNYPHVTVNVKNIEEEVYQETIENAMEEGEMPAIFYQEELNEQIEKNQLYDISKAFEYMDMKDYYFSDEMKEVVKEYHQLPSGFVETVLYSKKGASDLSDEEIKELLEEQQKEGFEKALENFRNGDAKYLIAGTDCYYQFLHKNEAEIATGANAGNVKVQKLFKDENYGYLTDYWCISESATDKEKKCAVVLMGYFMGGNCQRSFFTVEGEKRSDSIPLYEEVFEYYSNGVSKKMEFLKEDLEELTVITEFEGVEDYYDILLEKVE